MNFRTYLNLFFSRRFVNSECLRLHFIEIWTDTTSSPKLGENFEEKASSWRLDFHALHNATFIFREMLQPLHESEWNCNRVWYVVKYATPRNSGTRNMTAGENSVTFDSDPHTKSVTHQSYTYFRTFSFIGDSPKFNPSNVKNLHMYVPSFTKFIVLFQMDIRSTSS